MKTRKLGELSGIHMARIVKPVGVRLRCEFLALPDEVLEITMSGDLALAIATEMQMLLPSSRQAPAKKAKKKTSQKARR